MIEEGTIDVDEGTATNESARRRTANIMANKQTVESFIKAKVHMDPKVASPALIKMYDYYYDDSYAPKKWMPTLSFLTEIRICMFYTLLNYQYHHRFELGSGHNKY